MHEVELRSGQNVDLYVRFGQRVTIEGGRIIADYVSQSPTGSESISIDLLRMPRDGTFFVAVSNCSPEAASYTLLYHQIICDPAPPPFITSCELKRNSTGAFYLVIKGERIRSVAMVTVGGVIPKKLRFKGPDEQGVFYRKIIAKGGICGSLPGTIVIIDSGPFPFFCSERCPY
jgi:hypothetical protein